MFKVILENTGINMPKLPVFTEEMVMEFANCEFF